MITISLLVLVGCDNYEFVNTDEYHVIKKEEVKEFESEIKWDGLNILTELEVKHLDGRFFYKVLVKDLDGEPIQEQDYYEALRKGNLRLLIRDKDDFKIVNEIPLKVSLFNSRVGIDNKTPYSLVTQGSIQMEETTYIKIDTIRVGTSGT